MRKTLLSILFALAIPVSVFLFPRVFSAVIGSAVYIAIGFLVLMFALVFGSLAWKRVSPESFSKSGITISEAQRPGYVGSPGVGSRLRVEDTDTGIHVEWARLDYGFVLIALCLFGPGMILLYIRSPQKFNHDMPPLAIAGIAAFVLFISGAFVRTLWVYLWDRPSLQVTGDSIGFLAGKKSIKTLSADQIHSLFIRGYSYSDGHGRSVPNYILAAEADAGEELLCISDSQPQIEQLMNAIAGRMNVKIQASPPPGNPLSPPAAGITGEVKAQVKSLKDAGELIDAIKLVRDHSKMDLREAKEYVELL